MLPSIQFEDVTLGYPGHPRVIESLTCYLEGPGFLRLEGPNGSGKSTLLEALAGHLPPSCGYISACGRKALQGRQESVAFVRTAPALADSVTMRDHCLLFGGREKAGIERISQLVRAFGIEEYLDYVPAQLSSGTQRKFWISLGLIRKTPVLLLDEPFNELDEGSSKWLFDRLTIEAATRLVIVVCHIWPAEWPLRKVRDLTENLTLSEIPVRSGT